MHLYLRSDAAQNEVKYSSVGAIQAHYNTATLASLLIPLPTIQEQRELLSIVDKEILILDKVKTKTKGEIEFLKEYRTALISEVVTRQDRCQRRGYPMSAAAYLEQDFEEHIEEHLLASGYHSRTASEYDKEQCLVPEEVLKFIKSSQPKEYEKLQTYLGK